MPTTAPIARPSSAGRPSFPALRAFLLIVAALIAGCGSPGTQAAGGGGSGADPEGDPAALPADNGAFSIAISPAEIGLPIRGKNLVDVQITRHPGFTDAIEIRLEGAEGVASAAPIGVAVAETSGTLELDADEQVVIGQTAAAHVVANSNGKRAAASLAITITPPTGELDTSFGQGGIATFQAGWGVSTSVAALAIQTDGSIVCAGGATVGDGSDDRRAAVVRLSDAGAVDTSFADQGAATIGPFVFYSGRARAVGLSGFGRVVVAGSADSMSNGPADFMAARLLANGKPDLSFGAPDGYALIKPGSLDDEAIAIHPLDDGRVILVGASERTKYSDAQIAIVRLAIDGKKDPTFGQGGVQAIALGDITRAEPKASLMDGAGRLVIAGLHSIPGQPSEAFVMRVSPDGELDSTFGQGGTTRFRVEDHEATPDDVLIASDGSIVVSSTFYTGEGNGFFKRGAITRFGPHGALDTQFDPTGSKRIPLDGHIKSSRIAIDSADRVLVGVRSFPNENGLLTSQTLRFGRLRPNGDLDPAFGTLGELGIKKPYTLSTIRFDDHGRLLAAGSNAALRSSGIVMRITN